MKALMDQIKLQREIYIIGTLLMGGLYLFGIILYDIIAATDDELTTAIYLGSIVACGGVLVFVFWAMGMHLVTMFNYAVAMGRTRKGFLPAYMAAAFLSLLALCLEMKLLNFLEGLKLRLMYPMLESEDPTEFVMRWKCLLAIALIGTAVGIFIGTMFIKFGKAALCVCWIIFMAVCIGGPRLLEVCLHHPDNVFAEAVVNVFGALAKQGSAVLPAVIIICAAFLFGISYLLLKRQQVRL